MKFDRWFDRSQPQTLQSAVIFQYINTAFGLLMLLRARFGSNALFGMNAIVYLLGLMGFHPSTANAHDALALSQFLDLAPGIDNLILILIVAGGALGALAMANERKWGYILSIALVGFDSLGIVIDIFETRGHFLLSFNGAVSILWEVVLAVLLLRPASRNHYRIWFR